MANWERLTTRRGEHDVFFNRKTLLMIQCENEPEPVILEFKSPEGLQTAIDVMTVRLGETDS